MKIFVQKIFVSIVLLLAFSCGDDFLTDEPSFFGEGSAIVVMPDMDAQDYPVYCQGAGNAKFTVSSAPAWLEVSSKSGRFIDEIAILNCKAKTNKDFYQYGIYHALITLSVEGKGKMAVPVMYVVEGNPVIEIESSITVSYENHYNNLYFYKSDSRPGLSGNWREYTCTWRSLKHLPDRWWRDRCRW